MRRDVQQKLQRGVVGPVQVIEQRDHRRLLGRPLDVLEVRTAHEAPLLFGWHGDGGLDVRIQPAQTGHDRRALGGRVPHRGAKGLRHGTRRLLGHLDEWNERRGAFHLVTQTGERSGECSVYRALRRRRANCVVQGFGDKAAPIPLQPVNLIHVRRPVLAGRPFTWS